MKKRLGALIVMLVLASCLIAGISYFHVSGRDIAGIADMDESCEVEVTRHDMLAQDEAQQYVLQGPQIEQLRQLILGSSFTRRLRVLNPTSHDSTFYSISIYFHDRQDVVFLQCTGGDSMVVYSTLDANDNYDLIIRSNGWKAALEGILQAAENEQH